MQGGDIEGSKSNVVIDLQTRCKRKEKKNTYFYLIENPNLTMRGQNTKRETNAYAPSKLNRVADNETKTPLKRKKD